MKKILIALALVLLLLPAPIFAADGDGSSNDKPEEGRPIIDIGAIVAPIVDAINAVPNKTADSVVKKVEERADDVVTREALKFVDIFTFKLAESLHKKPGTEKLEAPWKLLVAVIITLLIILLYFSGIRFMLSGGSAEKRAAAKESLHNIALIFFLTLGSYWLYTSMLDLTYGISAALYPEGFVVKAYTTAGIGSLVVRMFAGIFYTILTAVAWLTLFVVKIMQMLGVVLFPIGVLLYFSGWHPAKQLGSSILMFLVLMMFIPLLDTVIFSGTYAMGFGWALAGLLLMSIINWQSAKKVVGMIIGPIISTVKVVASVAAKAVALAA